MLRLNSTHTSVVDGKEKRWSIESINQLKTKVKEWKSLCVATYVYFTILYKTFFVILQYKNINHEYDTMYLGLDVQFYNGPD